MWWAIEDVEGDQPTYVGAVVEVEELNITLLINIWVLFYHGSSAVQGYDEF